MGVAGDLDWTTMGWDRWDDPAEVTRRLRAGADPDTGLWEAVVRGHPDAAPAFLAGGADPWRAVIGGWSPGRLTMLGETAGRFGPVPAARELTAAELDAVAEARRLRALLSGTFQDDGFSVACAAGLDAAMAVDRLGGTTPGPDVLEVLDGDPEDWWDAAGDDDFLAVLGVTDVPGGVVLAQPWGSAATGRGAGELLSAGGRAYSLYANPKSGNQGASYVDGVVIGSDLHPGGGVEFDDTTAEGVLLAHLHRGDPVGYACALAGVRPQDDRAFTAPDRWVHIPGRLLH